MSRMNGKVPILGQRQQISSLPVMKQITNNPLAYPTSVAIPTPGGIPGLVVTDGLTKLEQGALMIAAGMGPDMEFIGEQAKRMAETQVAQHAVALAQAVLDECSRRQSPNPAEEPAT